MMSPKRLLGPPPKPLHKDELERVLTWHQQMTKFYAVAMAMIALGYVAILFFSHITWVPTILTVMLVGLLIAGAFVQFREKCPRCTAPLGGQARFMLPKECKNCGVSFERPGRT
jgi:hypothetical protein